MRPTVSARAEKEIDDIDSPEVIPLKRDDDRFHPYSGHPYETETFWVSFHHRERKLGGWFYNQVLFNQGICNGAWVWDDSPAGSLYSVNQHELPLGDDKDNHDLRDVMLPNGNHVEMREPLMKYRVTRSDPGRFEADLVFDGLREPHSHPVGLSRRSLLLGHRHPRHLPERWRGHRVRGRNGFGLNTRRTKVRGPHRRGPD
jgi:hypothetical protein